MGDWDRHRKQWRWAKMPGSPLLGADPRGPRPGVLALRGLRCSTRTRARDPRFQKFGPRYAGIGGLTFNGWEQDRRLLGGLLARGLRRDGEGAAGALTDEAIEEAVRHMPPEWYAVDGPRLVADLRARRDALPEAAEKYYRHLASRVDVYMTNRSERVAGGPHAERRHGGHGARARRRRAGGGDHLPPRVRRERDGGGPLLRARRGRHGRGDRRRPGPARAHDRRQGRRHPRRDGRRQGEAVRLGGPQPRDRARPSTTRPTTLRPRRRTRPGSRRAT